MTSSTMKAIQATRPNPDQPPVLQLAHLPIPTPSPNHVLVSIRASPIQPADILNSHGGFPKTTFPRILGKDFSGVVVGPSDSPLLHKSVFGTSGKTLGFTVDGGQAEFVTVPAGAVVEMPSRGASFAQAAAAGTPLSTAALCVRRGKVRKGETVVVLGAGGAVGRFVAQIVVARGGRVIGVGRRVGNRVDVDSNGSGWGEKVKEINEGRGVDVVVDTVGDLGLLEIGLEVLGDGGRLVMISAPRQGSRVLGVDVLSLYRRQVELIGVNSAGIEQEEAADVLRELVSDVEDGKLQMPEESSLNLIPIEKAMEAYEGKIKKAVIVFEA